MTSDPMPERDREGRITYVHYHSTGGESKLIEAPTRWWHIRRRSIYRRFWKDANR